MVKVVYVGGFDVVEIEHPVGRLMRVVRGEPVELPSRLAHSLLEQEIWEPAPKPSPQVKDGGGDAS